MQEDKKILIYTALKIESMEEVQ